MALSLAGRTFALSVDVPLLLRLFVVALPIVLLDAATMFADNICDLEQDVRNQRFTLPYYLGRDRALRVYPWLPALAYLSIGVGVALRLLPWPVILVWGLWPLAHQNTHRFLQHPSKQATFITAIHTMLVTFGAEVAVLIGLAGLAHWVKFW
ncbi:prenyltransferase [Lacticaseibacillus suihuaensis]